MFTRPGNGDVVYSGGGSEPHGWWQRRAYPALALAVGIVASTACASTPRAPAEVRQQAGALSLTVPATWTCTRYADHDEHKTEYKVFAIGFYCEGTDGSFIEVSVDPGAGAPETDSTWPMTLGKDGRVTWIERGICPVAMPALYGDSEDAGPGCSHGDGRLDIDYELDAGGHVYVILFGNTRRETSAPLEEIRQVLGSIRVADR